MWNKYEDSHCQRFRTMCVLLRFFSYSIDNNGKWDTLMHELQQILYYYSSIRFHEESFHQTSRYGKRTTRLIIMLVYIRKNLLIHLLAFFSLLICLPIFPTVSIQDATPNIKNNLTSPKWPKKGWIEISYHLEDEILKGTIECISWIHNESCLMSKILLYIQTHLRW